MIIALVAFWSLSIGVLIGLFLAEAEPATATPEPDFLADQPTEVLSDNEVARRFDAMTRSREWGMA